MHATLVSAIGLASLFRAISARALVERQADCVNDPVRIGLWENPVSGYRDDVNTFCNSLLGIPLSTNCLSTATPTVITYGAVTATSTITGTTTVPSSTFTVTVTSVAFQLRKLAMRAAITEAPYLNEARQAIDNDFAKRQASTFTPDYTSSLVSGCRCGPPTQLTTNGICTGPASTRTIEGFNTTTSYKTVTAGSTTVTETVNATTRINTSDLPTSAFSHSNWDDWANSTTWTSSQVDASSTTSELDMSSTTSSSEVSSTTTTEESSSTDNTVSPNLMSTTSWGYSRNYTTSSAEQTSSTTSDEESSTTTSSQSTSEDMSSSSTVDTPSGTSVTTTTSATISSTPSSCPRKNGTVFSSNVKDCTEYEYICGRRYPPSSYYEEAFSRASPEDCTEICDAANEGEETPCVGIIWNTTSTGVNCRTLKNLDNPIDDDNVIALILRPNAYCNVSSSSTPPYPTMPTGTESRSVTQPPWATGTGSRTWDHSWNGTWSYSYNRTRTWPTSYSKPTYTTSANVSMSIDTNLTSTTTSMDMSSTSVPYLNTSTTAMNMTSTSTPVNVTSTSVPYANSTSSPTYTTSSNSSMTISPNNTSTTSFTYSPSSGTGFPSSTLNSSTCPASTVTVQGTVYASVISYVTETQTVSQRQSVETVTETQTAKTKKKTETITETQTTCISQSQSVETITETQTVSVSASPSVDTVTLTVTTTATNIAMSTAGRYAQGWQRWNW